MINNRRGQEGLTLTTLLLIVLGIVVVVVVIIGFTTGFDFIFGKVEQLPGQSLQAAVEACKLAANQKLSADYCLEYRKVEVNGKEVYATCDYSVISALVKEDNTVSKFECTGTSPDAKSFCENKKLSDSTAIVSGSLPTTCGALK